MSYPPAIKQPTVASIFDMSHLVLFTLKNNNSLFESVLHAYIPRYTALYPATMPANKVLFSSHYELGKLT